MRLGGRIVGGLDRREETVPTLTLYEVPNTALRFARSDADQGVRARRKFPQDRVDPGKERLVKSAGA
jgi:hypothetical protein